MSTGKKFVVGSLIVLIIITVMVVKGQIPEKDAVEGVSTFSETGFGLVGAALSGLWHLLTG